MQNVLVDRVGGCGDGEPLIPGAGLRVAPRSGERGFAALAWAVAAGALGNMGGAATNALLFFSLRGDAFTVAVVASLLTGALGGWLAAVVGRHVATVCRRETNAPTREGLAGTVAVRVRAW